MLPALCLNDLMTRAEQGENLNRTTGKETKPCDSSPGGSRGVGGGHWVPCPRKERTEPRDSPRDSAQNAIFLTSRVFKRRNNETVVLFCFVLVFLKKLVFGLNPILQSSEVILVLELKLELGMVSLNHTLW